MTRDALGLSHQPAAPANLHNTSLARSRRDRDVTCMWGVRDAARSRIVGPIVVLSRSWLGFDRTSFRAGRTGRTGRVHPSCPFGQTCVLVDPIVCPPDYSRRMRARSRPRAETPAGDRPAQRSQATSVADEPASALVANGVRSLQRTAGNAGRPRAPRRGAGHRPDARLRTADRPGGPRPRGAPAR